MIQLHQKQSLTTWSMHVTTDILSVVRINQMIDQNTRIIVIFIVIPLNIPELTVSSRVVMAIARLFPLVRIIDYKCSDLVYQTQKTNGIECYRDHRGWKV